MANSDNVFDDQYLDSSIRTVLGLRSQVSRNAAAIVRLFDTEDGRFVLDLLRQEAGLMASYENLATPGLEGKMLPMSSDDLMILEGRRQIVWVIEHLLKARVK